MPSPRISIHDSCLYNYQFDSGTSTLVLRTVYPHSTPKEYVDVWFEGVLAHHLENIVGADIIFDIEESSITREITKFGDLFTRLEPYGWPPIDYRQDTIASYIDRHGLRVWHLDSSYGVDGIIIAKSMVKLPAVEHPPLQPPAQARESFIAPNP